jgi:hypothetical protein
VPQVDLDDLDRRLRDARLARRAAGHRVGVRRRRRRPPRARGLLARRLRLARARAPPQRPPAVHHHDRRPDDPLRAPALARAGRHPPPADPRVAEHVRGLRGGRRPAGRPAGPRGGGRAGVPPGDPVAPGLRLLGPDARARLGDRADRPGVGRADAPPGLRPLPPAGRRHGLAGLAGGRACGARQRPSASTSTPSSARSWSTGTRRTRRPG